MELYSGRGKLKALIEIKNLRASIKNLRAIKNKNKSKEIEKKSNEIKKKSNQFSKDIYEKIIKNKKHTLVVRLPHGINPLVVACQQGDLNMVKALVEGHDTEMTRILLERMINNEGKIRYEVWRSPIDAAKNAGHIEIVKYLKDFATKLLHSAIEEEDLKRVEYLVKTFTTIDVIGHKISSGNNSLHCAAAESKKNVETLQFLIKKYNGDIKDIINQKNKYGYTPLGYSYTYNQSPINKDIVALLRQFGGKANYYDKNGNYVGKSEGELSSEAAELKKKYKIVFPRGTPLVCACEKGRLVDVRLLIDGHDVNTVVEMVSKEGASSDGHTLTPLQSAAENEHLNIVKYLVKRFPTVDFIGKTNNNGYNSLHAAAMGSKKNVLTLQFLIDNYNKEIKDIINQKSGGWTPLDYAYKYNKSSVKKDIVALLRRYGGNANWYDKEGNEVGKGNGDLNDLYDNITIKF